MMREHATEMSLKKRIVLSDLLSSPYRDVYLQIQNELGRNIHPRQILHHVLVGNNVVPKCPCGNNLAWHADFKRYRDYCSKQCTAKYTTITKKQHRIEQGLSEWHTQTVEWKNKTTETSINRYGVPHYSKTSEFTARIKETNNLNFGTDYPAQSDIGKDKMKATCIDRYGVEHPASLIEIQNKIKATVVERYGVEHPAQAESVKEKTKKTCVDKYGVDNPLKAISVQQNRIMKCIENFGVAHPMQKHYSAEAIDLLFNKEILKAECQLLTVYDLSIKYNVSPTTLYLRLKEYNIDIPKRNISRLESKIFEFIRNNYDGEIIQSNRSTLKALELDIYLPNICLAFECNGTYWHSESCGKGPEYHLAKTNLCQSKNISLMHIWEHDWSLRSEIVKSQILNKLEKSSRKFARNTKVAVIDKMTANTFFEANHLQGKSTANTINIGLIDNSGNLFSVMGFGKSRYNKKYEWELIRFATKLNYNVVGGASKIFNYFVNQYNPKTIVSYSDKAFSNGNVYDKLGFSNIGTSKPGYKYTNDYITLYSRHKFQKHKLTNLLENFDPILTEAENMSKHGYDRIWDCGNNIHVWTSKNNLFTSN